MAEVRERILTELLRSKHAEFYAPDSMKSNASPEELRKFAEWVLTNQ